MVDNSFQRIAARPSRDDSHTLGRGVKEPRAALLLWSLWTFLEVFLAQEFFADSYSQMVPLRLAAPVIIAPLVWISLRPRMGRFLHDGGGWFLAWVSFSLAVALLSKGGMLQSLTQPALYVLWTCFTFILAPTLLGDPASWLPFARWNTIAITLAVVFGAVAEAFSGGGFYASDGYLNFVSTERFVAGFVHPGFAGMTFASLTLLWAMMIDMRRRRKQPILFSVIACATWGIATVLTVSRTSLLWLGVVSLALIALSGRRWSAWVHVFLIAGSLGAAASLLMWSLGAGPSVLDLGRLSSGRTDAWDLALSEAFLDDPTEIAFGSYRPSHEGIRPAYLSDGQLSSVQLFRLDSTYIDMLISLGIVGLVAFVGGLAYVLYIGVRCRRTDWLSPQLPVSVYMGALVAIVTASWLPSVGNPMVSAVLPLAVGTMLCGQHERRFGE